MRTLFTLSLALFASVAMIAQDNTTTPNATGKRQFVDADLVELEVYSVQWPGYSNPVEFQQKGGSDWVLRMWVGDHEAKSLKREMAGFEPSRPMTYELMQALLETTGIELEKIIITQLYSGTYYAILFLNNGEERWEIDARPSDSSNLAMRMGAPIYATADLIESKSVPKPVVEEAEEVEVYPIK